MTRCLVLAAAAAAVVLAVPQAADAELVFFDGFEVSGSGPSQDINTEVPARQSGLLSSTYSVELSDASSQAVVEAGTVELNSDAVRLRTVRMLDDSASSQAALQLDTDFGGTLAGRMYTISFDYKISRTGTSSPDNWVALGLGGTAGVTAPNGGDADYGVLVRENGATNEFADGGFVKANAALDRSGDPISQVKVAVDETGATPMATLTLSNVGGNRQSLTFDPVPLTFEAGDDGRFFEIRAFQSQNADVPDGPPPPIIDVRIDNLTIDVEELLRLAGDANGDGSVTIADFAILRANFGTSGSSFEMGDFNEDGDVTIADFAILRANFGSSVSSAELAEADAWAASVPEPATLGLLAAAGLGLVRRR